MGLRGPSPELSAKVMKAFTPNPVAANASLTPGRGGRRHQPRAGTGVHETAKMAYNFMEPGYVHAARTGTVPESALGKGLLAAETTLDLAPGIGKAIGMALPFAYMRKMDNVPGTPSGGLANLTVKTENKKNLVAPGRDQTPDWHVHKYMEERPQHIAGQRHRVTEMKKQELRDNFEEKMTKKWRKDVQAMDPKLRSGLPMDDISTMGPRDLQVQFGLDQNPSLKILTENTNSNILRGLDEIDMKIESGEIKRLYGHKDASQTVKDFIRTTSSHEANQALGPQLSGGFRDRNIQARRTVNNLQNHWIEHADDPSRAGGFMYRDPNAFDYHGNLKAELEHLDRKARKATFPKVKEAKTKEIKNALQETGDYTGKQMPKGTGEQAETIRFMEEQMRKGKNIGFRYAQNRGMFV